MGSILSCDITKPRFFVSRQNSNFRASASRIGEHPVTRVVAHNKRFTTYSLLGGNLHVALFSQHSRRRGEQRGSRHAAAEDSRRAAALWRRDGAQLRGFAGAGQFVSFNVAATRKKGGVANGTALGAVIDAAATCSGVLAWTPKLNVFPMEALKSRTSAHHDSAFVTNGIAKTDYFHALLKAGGVFVVFVGGIAVRSTRRSAARFCCSATTSGARRRRPEGPRPRHHQAHGHGPRRHVPL